MSSYYTGLIVGITVATIVIKIVCIFACISCRRKRLLQGNNLKKYLLIRKKINLDLLKHKMAIDSQICS